MQSYTIYIIIEKKSYNLSMNISVMQDSHLGTEQGADTDHNIVMAPVEKVPPRGPTTTCAGPLQQPPASAGAPRQHPFSVSRSQVFPDVGFPRS